MVKERLIGLDAKELYEAFKRFFENYDYHVNRIEELIEEWKKEDG